MKNSQIIFLDKWNMIIINTLLYHYIVNAFSISFQSITQCVIGNDPSYDLSLLFDLTKSLHLNVHYIVLTEQPIDNRLTDSTANLFILWIFWAMSFQK